MTVQTTDYSQLIIGSILSLLSALSVLVVTYIFQWLKDKRDRNWLIEDRKHQRRLGVLDTRLQDVISYANKHFDVSSKLFQFQMSLIEDKDEIESSKAWDDLTNLLHELTKEQSCIDNLNDEILNEINSRTIDFLLQEISTAKSLKNKVVQGEEIDFNTEKDRLVDFISNASDLRAEIMKRIDELLGLDI